MNPTSGRHLANERDVYCPPDDPSEWKDQWVRFDTPEEAYAFVQEVGGHVDVRVIDQAAVLISAQQIACTVPAGATQTQPFQLVSPNPARQGLQVAYIGTGTLLIGTPEGIRANQGYGLATGQNLEMHHQVEMYAMLVGAAASTGVAYVYTESVGT